MFKLAHIIQCITVFIQAAALAQSSQISASTDYNTGKAAIALETQWRPGIGWQYPLLEVYAINHSIKPIEIKRVFLNGHEVKGMCDGIVWADCYPTSTIKSGETVVLQINLIYPPKVSQTLEVETQQGQVFKTEVPRFSDAPVRIVGAAFHMRQKLLKLRNIIFVGHGRQRGHDLGIGYLKYGQGASEC